MGTLNKLFILYLFFNGIFLYSQSCIIKINKKDSIKLEKQDNEYYNEYLISIYNTTKTVETYKITPVKREITKKDKVYNIEKSFERKTQKRCSSKDILFLIDNKFYKHIKTFE